jgi:spore coat protein CotF
MKLAAHEVYDLHELTISCVNSITSMAMFINVVKDQELKAMIQTHFQAHIQDYNIKVEYLSNENGPSQKLKVPVLNKSLQDYIKSPASSFPSITPRTDLQEMTDREIATAYLLTLKRAGREYAWSAMEASNPGLRDFLKDAFTMSCNHAYDVWQYMVKKGYYPLEPASAETLNTLSAIYKEVKEPALV